MSGTMNGPNGDYQQSGQFNPYGPNSGRGVYPPNSQGRGMGMSGQMPHSNPMMPPTSANYNQQRMASNPNASQGGTTPTLNQLLQTPNNGQRYPSPGYGDYGNNMGPAKSSNQDMMQGGQGYGNQGWGNQQRHMNPYQQQQMQGNPAFRNQVCILLFTYFVRKLFEKCVHLSN